MIDIDKVARERALSYIESIKELNSKYYPDTEPLINPDDMLEEFTANFKEQLLEVEKLKNRRPHDLEYDFSLDQTVRFKVAKNWYRADEEGEYFGHIRINDRVWAIVLFDGEDDPDMMKIESILIKGLENWESVEKGK